jgi:hypothetical protein
LNRSGKALCFVPALLLLAACSSAEPEKTPEPIVYPEGISATEDGLVFSTGEFEIQPGEERFLCYAKTLEEDAIVDAYSYTARQGMHHFVFARTTAPEPDGFSECDVLFRPTWQPLFIATTADAKLEIPEGAANIIPAGSQLLIQLHLLTTGDRPIRDRAVVQMSRSPLADPVPAGIFAFGTTNVLLPPNQTTTLQSSCTVSRDVQVFAMMAHMHYLGSALRVEIGPDANSLETVYTRDPYDFDNQEIDLLPLTIPAGYATRTSCTYENTRDEEVAFGESSLTEMCFAIGFAVDIAGGVGGCIESGTGKEYPHDPAAGECADVVPNDLGVGAVCTEGGGQCAAGLSCSADLRSTENGQGQCIRLGCTDAADCGGGSATCCSLGLTDICIPEACRPLTCAPK